jgi:hypothetical protein
MIVKTKSKVYEVDMTRNRYRIINEYLKSPWKGYENVSEIVVGRNIVFMFGVQGKINSSIMTDPALEVIKGFKVSEDGD